MEQPDVPDATAIRFRAELRTRWSDEDNHGVLNNAVYATLFEEARLAYFTALGLMEGARFPFVLAQTNTRFLRPGRGGAEVLVELCTLHLGRTSMRQVYRVLDAATGDTWCEAEAILVGADPVTGEKRELAGALRERITAFEPSL